MGNGEPDHAPEAHGATADDILAAVRRALLAARVAEQGGDDARARQWRDEALRLVTPAGPSGAGQGASGGDVPAERGRTSSGETAESAPTPAQLAAVKRGERLAKRPALKREDIAKLAGSRDEGKRITALAIIQKRPSLGSLDVLIRAIAGSRSPFEQHQGVLAALETVSAAALDGAESTALRTELRRQLDAGHIAWDSSVRLAERILDSGRD